jgi:hypothetical protein
VTMFRAAQNPSNGEITVVRIPLLDGLDDTFTFRNLEEMRSTLLSRHAEADIDEPFKELRDFGSIDFSVR